VPTLRRLPSLRTVPNGPDSRADCRWVRVRTVSVCMLMTASHVAIGAVALRAVDCLCRTDSPMVRVRCVCCVRERVRDRLGYQVVREALHLAVSLLNAQASVARASASSASSAVYVPPEISLRETLIQSFYTRKGVDVSSVCACMC
jgi:hypothetical protein